MCFGRENQNEGGKSQTHYSIYNCSSNNTEFCIEDETTGPRCAVVGNNMLRSQDPDQDQAGNCAQFTSL